MAQLAALVFLSFVLASYAYDNCMTLDEPSNYTLQWSISADGKSIDMMIAQDQWGWAGLGFQYPEQETMGPGDFITGWARQNFTVVLQDRYLKLHKDGLPFMDPHQDLTNVKGAYSDEGSFFIQFSRLLNTGDPNDMDLSKHGHNLTILHAFGNLPAGDTPSYHGPNRGRTTGVNLFPSSPQQCKAPVCPNNCNNHGICNSTTKTCKCSQGWLEPHCERHDLSQITLAPGFKIEYWASGVTNARIITQSKAQPEIYYVGTRSEGSVYALIDKDGDGMPDEQVTIASKLTEPNGVLWHQGDLYISQPSRIIKFANIDSTYKHLGKPQVVVADIPTANSDWHGWKILREGPDGSLYVNVGSPCNYCLSLSTPGDPKPTKLHEPWGSISKLIPNSNGTFHLKPMATGIRDTQGFDFHPVTGHIWFTDNGRDNMGVDKPWDELNYMPETGLNYGFPFCYGYGWNLTTGGPDPLFYNGSCDAFTPAALELGPHIAPLGAMFYTGDAFPDKFKNSLLIAYHGSWNRPPGEESGYKVVVVFLDDSGTEVVSQMDLATGWLLPDKTNKWGRPVSTFQLKDGSILVTDDLGGAIFRISYDK